MADGASELQQKIFQMRVRYDEMADTRVADKKALEQEIRDLQEQLDALQGSGGDPAPSSSNPMEQEAKENIDALKDIVGAESDLTRLNRDLQSQQRYLEDLARRRHDMGTADNIRDTQQSIRDIEHQINALDPTTESLDLLNDSATAVAAHDAYAAHVAAQQREKEEREAAQKAARDAYDKAGPSEREVLDDQKHLDGLDNPYLDQQIIEARAKDDALRKGIEEGQKAGCVTSPTVLAGIGIGIAVVIAVILLVLNGGSDENESAVDAGGTTEPSDDGDTTATGDEDLATYAGHYEFASGFDDPKTAMQLQVTEGAYDSLTVTSAGGAFDVDATGTITGGDLQVTLHAASADLTCDFTFDAGAASGSVAVYGDVGAIGAVTWSGQQSNSCMTEGYDTAQVYNIGIIGGEVTVCGTYMAPTLQGCQDPYPVVVGTFAKKG